MARVSVCYCCTCRNTGKKAADCPCANSECLGETELNEDGRVVGHVCSPTLGQVRVGVGMTESWMYERFKITRRQNNSIISDLNTRIVVSILQVEPDYMRWMSPA